MELFGQKLKLLRKNKKISQKDFGKLFGLAESTISMYERDERRPDFDLLNKFADYFEVSTDYLLGRSNHPKLTAEKELEVDAEVDELMKILKAMPPKEQQEMKARILAYAQGLADAKKNK